MYNYILIHDKTRIQHVSITILYKIFVMFLVDNAMYLITLCTYMTIIIRSRWLFLISWDLNQYFFFSFRLFLQHASILYISP